MGNVSSGSSGVQRFDEESSLMEVAHDMPVEEGFHAHHHHHHHQEATLSHLPYHMPLNPGVFTSQVPTSLKPHKERMQIRKNESVNISINQEHYIQKKQIPTMIIWTHGGITVAVEGSWDNWTMKELLQRAGDDFVTVKHLLSGIYHYRFIVNGRWAHDEQLPCAEDDMGRVCNILDVRDYFPEATEIRSALESPPSPNSSYNNTIDNTFYAKEPPFLPPILHSTILNISQHGAHKSLPRPPHVVLDHLYIQETRENPPVLGIGSTQRFREKYVTVELYGPARKPYE